MHGDDDPERVRGVAVRHHHQMAPEFERRYEEMARGRFSSAFAYGRSKIDRIMDDELSGLEPGSAVLDVGCGTGMHLGLIERRGHRATGVEPASAMREAAERDHPGADIRDGVASELSFDPAMFDLVTAIEVYRYLDPVDIELAYEEAFRVLAPGGRFLFTMVNRDALDGFWLLQHVRERLTRGRISDDHPHCEFVTPAQVEQHLRRVGFVDVHTEGRLFAPIRIAYKVSTRLGSALARPFERLDDRGHVQAIHDPIRRTPHRFGREAISVMSAPLVVLSLDFELRWGVLDRVGDDLSVYRSNLEGVPEAIRLTLDAFDDYDARATWALVGAVACHGWDEWGDRCPEWPHYERSAMRWSDSFRGGPADEHLYFAPSLVEEIAARGHEMGSHSFMHLYLQEPGVTRADLGRDCDAMNALFADRWGLSPSSFVFPRNQKAHVDILEEAGIEAWRSNPSSWYWDTSRPTNPITRGLRAADAFLPWPNRRVSHTETSQRASHLVRFGLADSAWNLHLRRLLRDAAGMDDGEALHLWWHPHNLGAAPARSGARLRQLLAGLTGLPSAPRLVSMGMAESARSL